MKFGIKSLLGMRFGRYHGTSHLLSMWGAAQRITREIRAEVGNGSGASVVMTCLQWIGRTFPEAPPVLWQVDAAGERQIVAKHDLLRVLTKPNEFYSGEAMWTATLYDLNLTGNGYWLKIGWANRAGVAELWWCPSSMLEPKGDDETLITHYLYRPGDGQEIRIDREDVVHFRYGIDPSNQRLGLSPLRSVLREVYTDQEAAAFTSHMLVNLGVPGLLVSPKGDIMPSADDVQAVKDEISDGYTGANRGAPLVFSGPTDVQQFGFSPAQMDLKNLRRVPEERVSGALGIPAIVAGLGAGLDRSTFANYAEAREAAYEDNIIPTQRLLASTVRFQLLPDFALDPWDYEFGFDLSRVRVLQEDQDALATRYATLVTGQIATVAEGRRAVGLEATAADEVFLRTFATIAVPRDAGPTPPPFDDETPKMRGPLVKRQSPAGQRVVTELEKQARRLEATFARELGNDFDRLGQDAATAYLQAAEGKADDDAGLVARIVGSLNLGQWHQDHIKIRFQLHYGRTAKNTVDTINSLLDLGLMLPDEVQSRIIARGGTRAGLVDVEKQTRDTIMNAIKLGREEGWGPDRVARAIRADVPAGRFANGAGSKYRAEMIARTETKFAQNVSSIQAYKASDTITAVVAYDGRLGDSDEHCIARNGQTFTFEQADAELADEHPNGTLSFGPLV